MKLLGMALLVISMSVNSVGVTLPDTPDTGSGGMNMPVELIVNINDMSKEELYTEYLKLYKEYITLYSNQSKGLGSKIDEAIDFAIDTYNTVIESYKGSKLEEYVNGAIGSIEDLATDVAESYKGSDVEKYVNQAADELGGLATDVLNGLSDLAQEDIEWIKGILGGE